MKGEIREVNVPDKEITGNINSDLERIFYWGQNDFQPVKNRCSVSVGDVVDYFGRYFVVRGSGWMEISASKLKELQAIVADPIERRKHSMDYYFDANENDNEIKNNKETKKMSNFNLSGYLKNIFSSKKKDKEQGDQIETKLVEKNKGINEPEELTEKMLEKDRKDTEETTIEKKLDKVRSGSNEMLVEGQLNKSKSTIVKHRNAETAKGNINKLEEKRLSGETMESEKQEPSSVVDKPRRFYENKSQDGLKLAKSIKIAQIADTFDIDSVDALDRPAGYEEKLSPETWKEISKIDKQVQQMEDEESIGMREKAKRDALKDPEALDSINHPDVLNSIFTEEIIGRDDSSGTTIEERQIYLDLKDADNEILEIFMENGNIDKNILKQAVIKFINLNHIEDVVDEDSLSIEINNEDLSGSATYIVPVK